MQARATLTDIDAITDELFLKIKFKEFHTFV